MKVNNSKIGQNLNLTEGAKSDKASGAKDMGKDSKISKPDFFDAGASKVDVSDRAQQAKKIKELANKVPDIDQEKVAKFRQMIDEGKYKIDANAVASRMVDEHLETME